MFEALGQGFLNIVCPESLWIILVAAAFATVVGVLPVIGSMQVLALLIVFILYVPPEIGLLLLVAFSGVTETGGSMTLILVNIPGTGVNAATVIDGFPMTKKGEASRAVGAALTASMFGGVASVLMALVMIPLVIPLVMAMRIGDMVFLVLMGLAFLVTLTGKSVTKGLIAGFLGMFCSLVGYYYPAAQSRFAFSSVYLYEGLGIVPVVVGLYGVCTMLETLAQGEATIAPGLAKTRFSDLMVGVKDVLHYRWLWLRCTLLGYIVGVIPGIGGSVSTFGAYAMAKQTSKNPEKFGTGCVEGVIAPESANNATVGGALLTTLAFGIPGSAVMVIILAALYAVNVVPGPALVTGNLSLIFTLLIGLLVANIMAALICFGGARWLIRIAYTPMDFVFPLVMVLVFVGAYAERATILGIVVTIAFGLLGFVMTRLDYPKPAFILGFVLAGLFEENLMLALKTAGPLFFTTPISLSLIAIIVLLFLLPVLRKIPARRLLRGARQL